MTTFSGEARCTFGGGGWRCKRKGYDTKGWAGIRCWQHDPWRNVDEGEEAYKEHQWT